jgi:hypothetical protein
MRLADIRGLVPDKDATAGAVMSLALSVQTKRLVLR